MSICTIFAFRAKDEGFSATRSEKRQPTAISRSQASTAMLLAWLPCMPTRPVARRFSPRKPPAPITVMPTGASMRLANSSNSQSARERTTPPPQINSGFSEARIMSARMSMSR